MAAWKSFVSWFQHQFHLGVGVSLLSFLTQVWFSWLLVKKEFLFCHGHFVCFVRRPVWIFFFFFTRKSLSLGLEHSSGSTFVGSGSNDNFLFRTFAVTVLVFLVYLVQPGAPSWTLLVQSGFSRPCCLVLPGGRRESAGIKSTSWGPCREGEHFPRLLYYQWIPYLILLVGAVSWPAVVSRTPVVS